MFNNIAESPPSIPFKGNIPSNICFYMHNVNSFPSGLVSWIGMNGLEDFEGGSPNDVISIVFPADKIHI